jgi:hypothetical protein
MEFYSLIKKNEVMSFAGIWVELEIIIWGEISQTQKDKCCFFLSFVEARGKQNKIKQKRTTKSFVALLEKWNGEGGGRRKDKKG